MSYENEERVSGWTGWVVFASVMMIASGVVQVMYGLAAVLNSHWFVYTDSSAYLINVESWGWWLMMVGILIGISGALLWSGNMFGRVMGIIVALASAVANIGVFAAAPFWASLVIVVDALIIYSIWAHGGEMKQFAR